MQNCHWPFPHQTLHHTWKFWKVGICGYMTCKIFRWQDLPTTRWHGPGYGRTRSSARLEIFKLGLSETDSAHVSLPSGSRAKFSTDCLVTALTYKQIQSFQIVSESWILWWFFKFLAHESRLSCLALFMNSGYLKQNLCFWLARCCPPSKLKVWKVPIPFSEKKYWVQPDGARLSKSQVYWLTWSISNIDVFLRKHLKHCAALCQIQPLSPIAA